MKLTENTKVRIRVPKHLYESIQAELGKKDGMEEVESQTASLEEIAAAMDKALAFAKKLGKQIADKKGGSLTQKDQSRLVDNFRSKVREFSPLKPQMDESYENNMEEGDEYVEENLDEVLPGYIGMSPAEVQAMELAGQILAAVAAGTGLTAGIVNLAKKVKSKIQSKSDKPEAPVAEELEEVLDLNTLMEAVKDASKKKVEDKKKKELEAKKKKAEDDKKKKEAEAKKKAAAAKKK